MRLSETLDLYNRRYAPKPLEIKHMYSHIGSEEILKILKERRHKPRKTRSLTGEKNLNLFLKTS